MKRIFFAVVCLPLISALAFSQAKADHNTKLAQQQQKVQRYGGSNCGNDPILPTDGSSLQDYVNSDRPNSYLLHLKAGHSYSAEMWDPAEVYIGGGAQLTLLSSPGCSPLPTTNVASVDPDLSNNFADRISWIQATNSDAVLQANSLDLSGAFYTYVIRVTDTTLQNPYWSTYTPLAIQYALTNTTYSTLSGKLVVVDETAGLAYAVSVTLTAGKQITKIVASTGIASPGLHVAANHQGRAYFQFVGPAGSIIGEADFINNATPAVPVAPAKFEPRFSPR